MSSWSNGAPYFELEFSVAVNQLEIGTVSNRYLTCPLLLSNYEEEKAMPMKNPPHPGDFIRTEIIEPAGLTVTAAVLIEGYSYRMQNRVE